MALENPYRLDSFFATLVEKTRQVMEIDAPRPVRVRGVVQPILRGNQVLTVISVTVGTIVPRYRDFVEAYLERSHGDSLKPEHEGTLRDTIQALRTEFQAILRGEEGRSVDDIKGQAIEVLGMRGLQGEPIENGVHMVLTVLKGEILTDKSSYR
jgi:hypothetical protein